MARIIGGMFALQEPVPRPAGSGVPPVLTGRHVALATARSAFRLLDRWHSPARIWLPAYLCDVVVDAVLPPQNRVRFYPVGRDLRLQNDAWLREVGEGDMVVFISYFGFNTWKPLGVRARDLGALVVEDACQALFAEPSGVAHYSVYSPRKFVGVPDGGLLAVCDSGIQQQHTVFPASEDGWWLKAFLASQLRRDFDAGSDDRAWYRLFNETEPNAPLDPQEMSQLSLRLLNHCVRFDDVAEARRRNFRQLLESLGDYSIFKELPDGVVPLGFPITVRRRDEVRAHLFAHEIFPPVHWPVGRVVPSAFSESHELERVIMTLPCDQRCSSADMHRMTEVFLEGARLAGVSAAGAFDD